LATLSRAFGGTFRTTLKRALLTYIFASIGCILLIASIAIPNLMRSRTAANEASAVGALSELNAALANYHARYGQFPARLVALGTPADGKPNASAAGLIHPTYLSDERNGYYFEYQPFDTEQNGRPDTYFLKASPTNPGRSGERYFYTDQMKVIRAEFGKPAHTQSPPI
jgi:type II secretory pathway pseudopilin PulG